MSTELDSGLRAVADHPDTARFLGGRDEALIAQAERTLGVRFPASYRRFLSKLGAGSIAGEEFYGVLDADQMELVTPPNAVGTTLAVREDDPDYPAELVVVSDTGFGPDYVLDTAQRDERGESPVLVWTAGLSSREDAERDADSFGEWFARRVKAALEDRS